MDMDENKKQTGDELYECPECGLHYKDEAMAKKCAAWCKKTQSCNLEIIKHAVENN